MWYSNPKIKILFHVWALSGAITMAAAGERWVLSWNHQYIPHLYVFVSAGTTTTGTQFFYFLLSWTRITYDPLYLAKISSVHFLLLFWSHSSFFSPNSFVCQRNYFHSNFCLLSCWTDIHNNRGKARIKKKLRKSTQQQFNILNTRTYNTYTPFPKRCE